MTLLNNAYINPPVDDRLYLSEAQTVTSDAKSTNTLDFKGAGLFPMQAYLVIEPITLGTGEALSVQVRQSANSNMGSSDTLQTIAMATTTEQTIIPLSNTQMNKQYFDLYYDVSTGDSIPVTAYLTTA